ncbi:hypothetical protein Salat_0935400 [Sesamum alatum]|uniref:Uncharacterized protein n=1 Tax=Sesamum alatum TaxID=300844 RepID=A0AAE2CRE8_9LAMI|nr:hypothetical protein Salat_0935400 [Sesamum alatum]
MAKSVEEAGFWLPAEFLTDDDFLMGKENFNNAASESEFRFPSEFPYDFETGGRQRLEKLWVMSTSPQSTLAHLGSWAARSAGGSSNGSPNGVPSPPATPLGSEYDAIGDLIYRAAGQVAKLKLNGGHGPTKQKGLLAPPRSLAQFYPESKTLNPSVFPNTHFQAKPQNEGCGVWYSQQQVYQNRGGRPAEGMGQAAWTLQQSQNRGRPVLFGGSGNGGGGGGAAVKRACAGTGVFLPRRYGNNNDSNPYSSDSHKKPGCSAAVFPGRAAAHSHTNNFSNMNGFAQSQPQPQPRLSRGFIPDYNALMMARRHTVVLQQRLTSLEGGSSLVSRDLYLPQDWTY